MKLARINYKNPINLLLLIITIVSCISIVFLSITYYLSTATSYDLKISDKVYTENIIVNFASMKSTYAPGERAVFYLDIMNLYAQPISYIEFSIDVKYSFLRNITVYHKDDYSTRLFRPKVLERVQFLPSDAIEVDLPNYLPSGCYTFELETRPSLLNPPPKASIIIFIQPKGSLFITPLTALAVSASYFGILISDFDILIFNYLEEKSNIRIRPRSKLDWPRRKLDDVLYNFIEKRARALSLGQKIVLFGICSIMACASLLPIGLGVIADQVAILAYFLLAMGVINLIWEMKNRIKQKEPLFRIALNLAALNLLLAASRLFFLNVIIGALSLYVMGRIVKRVH